VRHFTWPWLWS